MPRLAVYMNEAQPDPTRLIPLMPNPTPSMSRWFAARTEWRESRDLVPMHQLPPSFEVLVFHCPHWDTYPNPNPELGRLTANPTSAMGVRGTATPVVPVNAASWQQAIKDDTIFAHYFGPIGQGRFEWLVKIVNPRRVQEQWVLDFLNDHWWPGLQDIQRSSALMQGHNGLRYFPNLP